MSHSEERHSLLLHANTVFTIFFVISWIWQNYHILYVCVYVREIEKEVKFSGEFSNSPNNTRMKKQWWAKCLMPVYSWTYSDHSAKFSQRNIEMPVTIGRSPFTRTVLTCHHCQIRLTICNDMIMSPAHGVWLTKEISNISSWNQVLTSKQSKTNNATSTIW